MSEFAMERLREDLEHLKMKNTLDILDNDLERAVADKLKVLAKYKILIIARRYEKASTVFPSNKPFSQWNEDLPTSPSPPQSLTVFCITAALFTSRGESYWFKERKEFMKQKQQIVNTLFEHSAQ